MGDFAISSTGGAGVASYLEKLRMLASQGHRADMHEAAADAVKPLVVADFKNSTDPYGAAWKPTKLGNSPLIGPTRDLSTSVRVEPTTDGFIVMVTDWKAIFHQAGTKHIPARPMLPVGGKMPPAWRAAIERSVRSFLAYTILTGS